MHRATIFISVVVLVAMALAATCLAQDVSTGAIRGTVFDPSIRRIAGASAALVNSATGFRYQQLTNGQGQFAFELLPPGTHRARNLRGNVAADQSDVARTPLSRNRDCV
jgi:Carboxypeptidase regulatory-like domain